MSVAALHRLTYLASDDSLWHGDLAEWSPGRAFDWCATHNDFDGPGDDRFVYSATREGLPEAIEAWIEEERDA